MVGNVNKMIEYLILVIFLKFNLLMFVIVKRWFVEMFNFVFNVFLNIIFSGEFWVDSVVYNVAFRFSINIGVRGLV